MIENSVFPVSLKQADIKPTYKKIPGMIRKTTGQYESYLICLKFMSVACIHRLTSTLTLLFLNISLDLEKYIMHSNVYLLCLKNGTCAALLADLCIAFDCLPHDLLIGKLRAYGCDLSSLKLVNWYLRNRHHNDHLESHKDLSWVPYFLISFFAIYFSLSKI